MGGIDQANQLRAAFTTHSPRNQKEFFPGAFWAINVAISNIYKLYLAINGSKTSSTGKRDPQKHRKYIEDLVDLLFQIKNNDFGVDFMSKDLKPYPKYQHQPPLKGPKTTEKEAFLKSLNGSLLEHFYALHPLGKRNYCFFYQKKSNNKPLKELEKANSQFEMTLQLNQNDLIDVLELEQPKQGRTRGKRTP
jgi:hypothetical protein